MSEIKFSGIVEHDFSDLEENIFVKAGERVEGYLNYHGETPYILGKIEDVDVEYVAPEFWVPVLPESIETELFGVKIPFTRLRELVKADAEGRVVVLPCKVGDVVHVDTEGFMGMPLPNMPMTVRGIVAELYGDWGDCKQTQYMTLEELAATEPKGDAT